MRARRTRRQHCTSFLWASIKIRQLTLCFAHASRFYNVFVRLCRCTW
jgi:hypothetical protein